MESVLPICRICLNTSMECIEFQTPFKCKAQNTKEANTLNYLECLLLCTRLPISEDDEGPQCICTACDSELQIVYDFLQKANNSHMILEENLIKDNAKVTGHIEISFENNENQLEPIDNNDSDNEEKNKDEEEINTKLDRIYASSYLLKTHLSYHGRKEVEHKSDACEKCGKTFSTQRYMRQHMVVHQDTRETLKCQYCDKEYVTKTALNSHERLHQGQKLECNECGKEFTRTYELKIHMRFHKREFPFGCTVCGKKFAIKGHLRTHMWQHQGIKVECEECGKLFSSTKALNEHAYTHTQMPYPCDFCHKAYPSRQKYKLHLEKVHLNEMKNLDLTQLKGLTNGRNGKKRKNFTYVQVVENEGPEDNK